MGILGSVGSGLGQALLWIAQGEYIGMCATERTQGFYFGFFWGTFNISQAVGNLIGGELLTKVSGAQFFLIMGLAMVAASLFFACLRDPTPIEPVEADESTFWQTIVDTWRITISGKMRLVNASNAMTGLSIAFFVGLLIPIMVLQ